MTPSIERWPTKAKEAPSPHEHIQDKTHSHIMVLPYGTPSHYVLKISSCYQNLK